MPDLRAYLESAGLRIVRQRGDEIEAFCPGHEARVGRPDTHASFGFNQDKGVGFCFSCKYSPTFSELILALTGFPPDGDVMLDVAAHNIATKVKPPTTDDKREALSIHPWMLEHTFADVPERVLAFKRITLAAANAYGLRWDTQRHCYVIPVFDISGRPVWVQLRQKHGVMNMPEGIVKSDFLYNIHLVKDREVVALVESPLDVVRLGAAGIPAVSSFGAMVSERQIRLLSLHFPRVVLALDNDEAGRTGASFVARALKKRNTAVHPWPYNTPEWERHWKDPGDCLSDDMLRNVWSRALRCGL